MQNVAAAQKEIERLEAEAASAEHAPRPGTTDTARKPAQANQAVNGSASADAEHAQEKDGVADATEDLKKASLEDATTVEGTA